MQFTYLVLKSLRFAGRNYEPGQEFNARRLDPNRTQLQRWVNDGFLGGFDQKPEPEVEEKPELSEQKLVALEALAEASRFDPEAEEEEDDGSSPF